MDGRADTRRSRWRWLLLSLCVMLTGLASRTEAAAALPEFFQDYSGDTLWALMVYCLCATAACRWPAHRIAACAIAFAYGIEFSQLFNPEWLETIRDLPGMRLVFGYGFLWSDLCCYTVGVSIGCTADLSIQYLKSRRPSDSTAG